MTLKTRTKRWMKTGLSTPQTPQLQRPEQQLHGGPVDGVCHVPVHRLRWRGASHLLRTQHLPPHWDHGNYREQQQHDLITSWIWMNSQTHSMMVYFTGSWLYRPGGGSSGQEAGADPSRETCPQLHDGLTHHQEGKTLKHIFKKSSRTCRNKTKKSLNLH